MGVDFTPPHPVERGRKIFGGEVSRCAQFIDLAEQLITVLRLIVLGLLTSHARVRLSREVVSISSSTNNSEWQQCASSGPLEGGLKVSDSWKEDTYTGRMSLTCLTSSHRCGLLVRSTL